MSKVRFHHDLIDDDFIFERGYQYPIRKTIVFNQIIGKTVGGQTKISKMGKSEQYYYLDFKKLSKKNSDNLKTWLEDSSIDWRRKKFFWYTGKMVGTGSDRVEEAYEVIYHQGTFDISEKNPEKYDISIVLKGELVMTANRALKTDGTGTIVVATVTDTELEYLSGAWTGTGDLKVVSGGTGTSTGSITGTTALAFTAGGSNQNASLITSGTGKVVLKPGTNSTTAVQLQNAAGTSILNVDATNSRIGIGTTGPDAKLDLLYASGAQLRLTHTDGTKFVDFTLDTNHDLLVKPSSTGQIKLQPTTNSTDFFQVLDANGGTPILNVDSTNERVGIGIATPTETLDVVGNIKLSGNVTTGTWTGVTVAVGYGGTNKAAWTQYAIPYLSDTTVFGEIAIGTVGKILTVSDPATGYEWTTTGAGDVMGPGTNTDNNVPQWDGLNSKTLKNGRTIGIADTNLVQINDAGAANDEYVKFTATGIEGRTYANVRTDLGLVIGTNVLAQQTIGILDNNLVELDHAGTPGVVDNDYAKFTPTGLEGRSYSEVRSDISVELNADVTDTTNVTAAMTDGAHGTRGGGTLHADVIAAGADGFMTGSDKTKLNSIASNANNYTLEVHDNTEHNPDYLVATHQGQGGAVHADVIAAGADGFMTGSDKTKLNNIETSADVTDAGNVASAGAIMDGDFGSNGLMKRTGAGTYAVATIGILDNNIVEIDHAGTPGVLNNDYAKWTANGLEGRSYGEVRSDISVELNADVTDAGNVASAGAVMDGDFGSNGLMERTGAGTYGITTITSAGKAILDDADAATQRTTLGLGTLAVLNSPLAVDKGGTGAATYTDGQLLIGNTFTGGLDKATLTASTGISVVNANGSITLSTDDNAINHDNLSNFTSNEHFVKSAINLNDLGDVSAASPSQDDYLKWDSVIGWYPAP